MVNELQTLRTHVVSLTAQAEALQQRHVEVQLQLEDTLEQLAEARVAQEQQQQVCVWVDVRVYMSMCRVYGVYI